MNPHSKGFSFDWKMLGGGDAGKKNSTQTTAAPCGSPSGLPSSPLS
jgi:hypothetical protein